MLNPSRSEPQNQGQHDPSLAQVVATATGLAARLWARTVESTTGCWLWTGCTFGPGRYGKIGWARGCWATHRVAYEAARGPIPAGAHVLHSCDEPRCVRPAHLFLGDAATNMADKTAKGRQSHRGGARLTREQARAIRQRYAAGGVTQRQLSASYDVGEQTISLIVRRRTWRGVA